MRGNRRAQTGQVGLANLPAYLIGYENFGLYYILKQLQHGVVDPFVPDLRRFERRTTTLFLHRV